MRACTTSRPDTKRGNPDGYQGNMTSGLAWIIRACLFQVCLWRACLCEEPICMYNEFLTEMVESLPRDYLFRVNKIEETFESVEKALSRFYRENCKKDFKCKDYTEDKRNSAVCYLLECLDGEEPECVSNVSYSLAEVELVSLKGFKCLVTDAFNHKYNSLQEVREQDKECDDVFVDAVRCQKATTLESQEQRLQRKVISVSTLLAISLIANIILLLGVVYLWTRGKRQHEGMTPKAAQPTTWSSVKGSSRNARCVFLCVRVCVCVCNSCLCV
ncbi:uncharacterized protein [Salvelinus alpinus]|uniref:uncharacterized protein isoform X5 n=1 Tax=Salvelinus alpinus TaxID=8036 RepID=UPI0039FCF881